MADTVTDVLQTRLDLIGLGEWTGGMGRAATATGLLEGKLNSAQQSMMGWGIALGAVSIGGFHLLIDAAKDAGEEAADFGRAVGNFKGGFPLEEMRSFTSGLSDLTGIEDGAIVKSLGLLGTFQLTGEQARTLELPILNAAESLKAMGVSAEGLALGVGKAIETGNVMGLKRMGVVIHDAAFQSKSLSERVKEVADALQKQGGPAAAAFAKTLPGQLQRLSTDMHELKEDLGESLIGPLGRVVSGVDGVVHSLRGLSPEVKTAAAVTGVVLAGAAGVASVVLFGLTVQTGLLAREQLLAAKAADTQAASLTKVALAGEAANVAQGGGAGGKAAGAGGFAKGLLKNALPAAGLALAGGSLGFIPDESMGGFGKRVKHTGENVLEGAAIGRLFGVPGAIVGGTLGLLKANIEDLFTHPKGAAAAAAAADPHLSEAQKQTQILQATLDQLTGIARDNALDTKGTLTGAMLVGVSQARARTLQH